MNLAIHLLYNKAIAIIKGFKDLKGPPLNQFLSIENIADWFLWVLPDYVLCNYFNLPWNSLWNFPAITSLLFSAYLKIALLCIINSKHFSVLLYNAAGYLRNVLSWDHIKLLLQDLLMTFVSQANACTIIEKVNTQSLPKQFIIKKLTALQSDFAMSHR